MTLQCPVELPKTGTGFIRATTESQGVGDVAVTVWHGCVYNAFWNMHYRSCTSVCSCDIRKAVYTKKVCFVKEPWVAELREVKSKCNNISYTRIFC